MGKRIEFHNKKESKGDETRRRIVEAAADLFVSQGYHATSTRQITEKLGMAKSSIYNHFNSKEEIFEAALNEFHPWRQIPRCVEISEGETVEELVRNAAERLHVEWGKSPDMMTLHLIELTEFQGAHLSDIFQDTFSQVTSVIQSLKKKRAGIANVSTSMLARAFLGLFFAFLVTDRFSGILHMDEGNLDSFDYFTDVYLQGLLVMTNNQEGDKKK